MAVHVFLLYFLFLYFLRYIYCTKPSGDPVRLASLGLVEVESGCAGDVVHDGDVALHVGRGH